MKLEIALYPFCGPTFTSLYEYADLSVGRCYSPFKNEYTISINIKNIGNHEGIEVVQLVFHDKKNQNINAKRLPGFSKVSLKPGESKNVKFIFAPEECFSRSFSENPELEIIAGKLTRKFSFQHQALPTP